MRSASYTRGATPIPPHHAQQPLQHSNSTTSVASTDPLFRFASTGHQTPVASSNAPPPVVTNMGGSGLSQYRRHSASFTATPYRTNPYISSDDGRQTNLFDSPKKQKAYDAQSNLGFFGSLMKSVDNKLFGNRLLRNNKSEFVGWFALFCVLLVVYKFFSDGSFSAVLTLSSAFQCFSMCLLNLKVMNQKSTSGVSQRSVFLIVICLIFRLVSTLFYNGYLPVDRSGDWVYQGADVMSLFLGVLLLTYAKQFCSAPKEVDSCNIVIPIVVAFVLAVLIHPTLNQNFLADSAWTFALYLETFAMIPQLFLMGKLGGEVEALTSHYVASMAASKFFSFLFWYFSYTELAPRRGGRNIAGWAVILSYTGQTLLFLDFFYYYIKSIRIGRKMIINF